MKYASERRRKEVGAVLVNDVPDCQLFERIEKVRDFEEHSTFFPLPYRRMQLQQEPSRVFDVLKDMSAANQICFVPRVGLGVEIADKLDTFAIFHSLVIAWVETEATVPSPGAEHRKELAPSAANLDDIPVVQMVLFDEFGSQFVGVALKAGGKM